MALAIRGLLCRHKGSPAFSRAVLTRWVRVCTRLPNTRRERGYVNPAAYAKDLAALGLSAEDLMRVEDVIAKTQATDISESIRVLTSYAGSESAASVLLRKHPNLLCCQLPSWVEFLTAFGLTKAQVQHVLCQTPEALIEGDLVCAGESLLVFRRLGLSDYASAQLVTYYPQLLSKGEEDIKALLGLLARYQTGIDSLGC